MATNENKKGFDLKALLNVHDIHSIKPRQAGSFKNDQNEEVNYGHAVKFKTIKVELVEDKDFGEKEVETILEIEVPCDTMTETVALNNHLKEMKKSGKSFNIDISMPNRSGGELNAKSIMNGEAFIHANKL